MSMKLENEFSVAAPLEKTWETLLDIPRVAGCLPGATLESDGADGVFRGRMRMKLGPMTLAYEGTAQMAEVEEDEHSATIEVRAKELKGQGSASARIRNQLRGGDGVTHVLVVTDLSITGRPAQFGRGIMEDVATRMLDDFARRLEAEVAGAPANGAGAVPAEAAASRTAQASEPAAGPEPLPEPPALDLGGAIAAPLAKRALIAAAVLMVLAGLVRAPTAPRADRDGLLPLSCGPGEGPARDVAACLRGRRAHRSIWPGRQVTQGGEDMFVHEPLGGGGVPPRQGVEDLAVLLG
jgi:carbon monoxide dehydrogenase subunit G